MTEPTPTLSESFEEPCELALRRELGLRPIIYAHGDVVAQGPECPPWCFVGQQDDWDHEITQNGSPFDAYHFAESTAYVAASRYPIGYDDELKGFVASQIAVSLVQTGGAATPDIMVQLNAQDGDGTIPRADLKLSVDDACDIVTALNHFIALANGVTA